MFNFEFHNPTRIVFGQDRFADLDRLIPADARVLILYGGGSVKKYGVFDRAKDALGERAVFEFGGIEPNPRFDTLMKAADAVNENRVDFLLAVGGGSVLDGVKFVALACRLGREKALELLKSGKMRSQAFDSVVPIGTILTLPATGSEMNSGGVISHEHGKYVFGHARVYPRFSILDPTVSYTLPPIQVANGIVDTFIHTTEQYLTYPVEARLQDRMAEGILRTLIEIGPKTLAEPEDYDSRANLYWCATMALNGVIGVGVPHDWATHMIGHELTAMFGIDHGQTLAIIAPSLWNVCRDQKKEKLLQYAERVWDITEGSDDERIDAAIARTREFFNSIGISTKLSEYGVAAEKVDDLVDALVARGFTSLTESKKVTPDVSRRIIADAM